MDRLLQNHRATKKKKSARFFLSAGQGKSMGERERERDRERGDGRAEAIEALPCQTRDRDWSAWIFFGLPSCLHFVRVPKASERASEHVVVLCMRAACFPPIGMIRGMFLVLPRLLG